MYNVVRDVLKNWWVILFIAISVSLLTYIGAAWMYHPTYTSSTTFVVSAKGSSTGAYANQSQTEKLTDTFQSVMNSQILKKKVSEDGYISGDGEDCCCTGDESSDGVCDERFPGDIVQAS